MTGNAQVIPGDPIRTITSCLRRPVQNRLIRAEGNFPDRRFLDFGFSRFMSATRGEHSQGGRQVFVLLERAVPLKWPSYQDHTVLEKSATTWGVRCGEADPRIGDRSAGSQISGRLSIGLAIANAPCTHSQAIGKLDCCRRERRRW